MQTSEKIEDKRVEGGNMGINRRRETGKGLPTIEYCEVKDEADVLR